MKKAVIAVASLYPGDMGDGEILDRAWGNVFWVAYSGTSWCIHHVGFSTVLTVLFTQGCEMYEAFRVRCAPSSSVKAGGIIFRQSSVRPISNKARNDC